MRHAKTVFSVSLTVLAVLSVSAPAFAESGILPRPTTISVSNGAGKFVSKNGLEVKCTSGSGEAKFSTDQTGSFTETFSSCTGPLGVKCTGLANETTGQITVKGSFTLVSLLGSSGAPNGVTFAPETTHFACGSILSVVRGHVIGKDSVSGTTGTIQLKQSKGVNEYTDYEGSGTEILETSTSGGKFEQSGEETTATETFSVASELMETATEETGGILPPPSSVSLTSGAGRIVTGFGEELRIGSDESSLSFTNEMSGSFDLLLLGVLRPFLGECKGLLDTVAGSVLMKGVFKIVKLKSSESIPGGIVLELEAVHYSCGGILCLIRGALVGKVGVSGTTLTMTFNQSKAKNEITSDETETGLLLEVSINGGKYEQMGLETTEVGTLESTSELMR